VDHPLHGGSYNQDAMMRKAFSSLVVLTLLAISSGVAFGADLFSGTWQMNPAKTSYGPFPRPKHPGQIHIEAVDDGITAINDFISDSGQRYHEEWALKFDGRDYPVKISYDDKPQEGVRVSGKKINDHTLQITMKSNGQTDSTSIWSVGRNTLTITAKTNGKITSTMVFDKKPNQ
jgi:hypothetical protein